jgi:hypothetical protein
MLLNSSICKIFEESAIIFTPKGHIIHSPPVSGGLKKRRLKEKNRPFARLYCILCFGYRNCACEKSFKIYCFKKRESVRGVRLSQLISCGMLTNPSKSI